MPVERYANLLTKSHRDEIQSTKLYTRGSWHTTPSTCQAYLRGWIQICSHHCWRQWCTDAEPFLPRKDVLPSASEMWNAKEYSVQNITEFVSARADICESVIGLHAFTCCNALSALLVLESWEHWTTWKQVTPTSRPWSILVKHLGEAWTTRPTVFEESDEFACGMYASSATTCEVPELRYYIFCAKHGDVESNRLPPCKDSLHMHQHRVPGLLHCLSRGTNGRVSGLGHTPAASHARPLFELSSCHLKTVS